MTVEYPLIQSAQYPSDSCIEINHLKRDWYFFIYAKWEQAKKLSKQYLLPIVPKILRECRRVKWLEKQNNNKKNKLQYSLANWLFLAEASKKG